MTEYTRLPLRKEDILNIKTQAEQACADYCKHFGVSGSYWDSEAFKEGLKNPEIADAVKLNIKNKIIQYTDNFELSCICEMALLYLKELQNYIEWHPIEEGLPKEDGRYLITVDRWSSIIDDWIKNDVTIDDFYMGRFSIMARYFNSERKPTIKAWAEMPKHYEEEK